MPPELLICKDLVSCRDRWSYFFFFAAGGGGGANV
jgi:hypothetical protein